VRGQPVFVMARPDGRQIWVNFAFPDNGKVDVIDTLAGQVVHRMEPGKGILHMEFAPRGENVWLSARDDNKVVIYNTETFAKLGENRPTARPASSSPARGPHRLLMDDTLDFHLLNDFQRDFPLCPAPFAELASRLGVAKRSSSGGWRTCAATARFHGLAPSSRPSASAPRPWPPWPCRRKAGSGGGCRQSLPEVNHNYEREHRYNLWFVVTAASEGPAGDAGGHRTGCRLSRCRCRCSKSSISIWASR
jgi:hypothetical protein